ncbi:MAG: choice-of-anchor Q domain-containing protein [Anaerolineales bacterium]
MKALCVLTVVVLSVMLVAGMFFDPQVYAATTTTIVVNTLEDERNTDGDCSLREAITASNSNGYVDACTAGQSGLPDNITFNVGGTIMLESSLPNIVDKNMLVIDGGDLVTVSGDNSGRVVYVEDLAQLTLENITVSDGSAPNAGAIYNSGTLTIVNSSFSNNSATDHGGGMVNKGTLTITDSRFMANSAANYGGGISNWGAMTVTNSTFSTNSAGWGGAIYNHEKSILTITNSTITHNDASYGGGIYNHVNGTLSIGNSTFFANRAANYGGGISNYQGSVTIKDNSTFSGNSANYGGAIDNSEGGTLRIVNSYLGGDDADQNSADWGGGIHNGGSLKIMKGTFHENSATHGGGIFNTALGMLWITNSYFNANYVTDDGGGIYNWGAVDVMDSWFMNNNANHGGGIYNHTNGTLDITNTDLSQNSAGWGGGIDNRGAFTVTNSTFSTNSASYGGGIYNNVNATLSIGNSTFAANSAADYGGGVSNYQGSVTIAHSTFSGNSANHGGAIDNSGTLGIVNTILANSPSGGNCEGTITDNGHNIEDINTCGFLIGSWPNTDPLIDTLGDNGGPTWTHALLVGSPAIDNSDPLQCPTTDQRGFPRPQDGDVDGEAVCDVGAFEFQPRWLFLPITIKD